MAIGAVGAGVNYYGTQTKKETAAGAEGAFAANLNASDMGSKSNKKVLGLTTAGDRAYVATYADASTTDKPIIKVGDYEVNVRDVNPQNATELEMFALMSYLEDVGRIEKKGIASFSRMRSFAQQAEFDGACSDIYDEQAFFEKKQDWSAIIGDAKQTFANLPGTYAQSIECGKLLSSFNKWNAKNGNGAEEPIDFHQAIADHIQALYEKIKNGDTEQKFQIGAQSLSIKEWDRLLEKFDDAEEAIKEAIKEEIEKAKEKAEKEQLQASDEQSEMFTNMPEGVATKDFWEAFLQAK